VIPWMVQHTLSQVGARHLFLQSILYCSTQVVQSPCTILYTNNASEAYSIHGPDKSIPCHTLLSECPGVGRCSRSNVNQRYTAQTYYAIYICVSSQDFQEHTYAGGYIIVLSIQHCIPLPLFRRRKLHWCWYCRQGPCRELLGKYDKQQELQYNMLC
jgi:hypothetical protein